jgi:hypothetical protein
VPPPPWGELPSSRHRDSSESKAGRGDRRLMDGRDLARRRAGVERNMIRNEFDTGTSMDAHRVGRKRNERPLREFG